MATAQQTLIEDCYWQVDEFLDVIKKRTPSAMAKERAWAARMQREVKVFETQGEAAAFMIGRAEKAVADAEKKLKGAKARLKKVQKKFGGYLAAD